jgi:hypothetical protein
LYKAKKKLMYDSVYRHDIGTSAAPLFQPYVVATTRRVSALSETDLLENGILEECQKPLRLSELLYEYCIRSVVTPKKA